MTLPFLDALHLDGHLGGVLPLGQPPLGHGNEPSLGQEYLLSDSGALSPVGHSISHSVSTTGTGSTTSSAPTPTLVTASGSNLQIDLVWDKSVSSAPAGFQAAVVAAAQTYVKDYTASSKEVIYIAVGWGEVGGTSMSAGALGESQSYGYLTNYATVTKALGADGYHFTASNEPTSGQFFVTSAEAKALGMVGATSGSASSVDGFVGFSTLKGTGYSWNMNATGTTSSQYNLQAVADHEISEVMGRVAMEGTVTYNGAKTYTPLDLFNYSAPGTLQLNGNGGYFSADGGVTHEGVFNNATRYGGDIGDWASYSSPSQSGTVTSGSDAFDAYGAPGYNATVSADDLLEVAALGYRLTPTGIALA